ncbi:MAG: hypothetical protein FGF53_01830 [Candidatus Brockarchaeota archaeon]|nr:hypothetical protein [Candidatus Brockarchaeota archaeon]MBO3808652.1 hypothetical protein [Candidatus Brockarchaeota archaeon]
MMRTKDLNLLAGMEKEKILNKERIVETWYPIFLIYQKSLLIMQASVSIRLKG